MDTVDGQSCRIERDTMCQVSLCPFVAPFPTFAQTTGLLPQEVPAEHLKALQLHGKAKP